MLMKHLFLQLGRIRLNQVDVGLLAELEPKHFGIRPGPVGWKYDKGMELHQQQRTWKIPKCNEDILFCLVLAYFILDFASFPYAH